MDTLSIIALTVGVAVVLGMACYLVGYTHGKAMERGNPVPVVDTLAGVIRDQSDRLTQSHLQAMNMASLIPEQQIDRVNAESWARGAREAEIDGHGVRNFVDEPDPAEQYTM